MRNQQISPWTFLKDNSESQNQRQRKIQANKVELRLPKLVKKRQSLSKQQDQSKRARIRDKGQSYHLKTMVFASMKYSDTESMIPMKKKTEPLLYEVKASGDQILGSAEWLDKLNQMKLIAKIIHVSLEQQSKPASKPCQPCLDQIRKKTISVPQPFEMANQSLIVRIHDKNIQSNLSALRSILKREYDNIHQLKSKTQKNKNNKHISALRLKLTEEVSPFH